MIKLDLTLDSLVLMTPVKVQVLLPSRFDGQETPIVYALHPAFADGSIFAERLGAGRYVDKLNFALAAPSLGNNYFVNHGVNQIFDFLNDELPQCLQRIFNLSKDSSKQHLLGISMGAYGALHFALQGRHKFAKAALISSVFKHEGYELKGSRRVKLIFNLLQPVISDCLYEHGGSLRIDLEQLIGFHAEDDYKTRFRLYAGDMEKIPLQQSELFTSLLRQSGFDAQLISEQGDHDEDLWSQVLPEALSWILEP